MKQKLQDVSPTDGSDYTARKKRNQELSYLVSDHAHPVRDSWFKSFEECSQRIEFELSSGKKLHQTAVWLCKNRICPICQMVSSRQNLQRILFKQEELQNSVINPRYIFLTLTVPNCDIDNLNTVVRSMSVAWHKLITNILKNNNTVFGFIRKLEVTRNSKTNLAHPHYHVLLQVSGSYFTHNYITQEKWLQMWQKAMKDDRITQVDVRAVKPGDTKAIVELTKYELKASEFADLSKLSEEQRDTLSFWLVRYVRQMKRIRRFSSGGTLKMPNLDQITPDDVSEEDIIAYVSAQWMHSDYYVTRYNEILQRIKTA